MNSEREILGDGNITKLIITPGNKIPVKWEKGMNALFHYTVHAYVPSTSSHSHKANESCCSKKNKMQKIMEMIEEKSNFY